MYRHDAPLSAERDACSTWVEVVAHQTGVDRLDGLNGLARPIPVHSLYVDKGLFRNVRMYVGTGGYRTLQSTGRYYLWIGRPPTVTTTIAVEGTRRCIFLSTTSNKPFLVRMIVAVACYFTTAVC